LIYRAWDKSGKADPYLKIYLNDDLIINDVDKRIYNTLEPIFGRFTFVEKQMKYFFLL